VPSFASERLATVDASASLCADTGDASTDGSKVDPVDPKLPMGDDISGGGRAASGTGADDAYFKAKNGQTR
jgi:hypothetical protein